MRTICRLFSISLFAAATLGAQVCQIPQGCTGATTAAGAWTNIFSGAGIASNCTLIQNVSGTLTCLAYTQSGALTTLGGLPVNNPKAFGALWDASTDDTAAINAASGALCTAGGGILFLPAGVGIFNPNTSSITLCSNEDVEGTGEGISTLRVKPGSGNFETIFGTFGSVYSYTTFRDFTLDYNTTNNQPTTFSGAARVAIGTTHGGGGTSMTWENVEFRDASAINIIYSGTSYTTIKNCFFELNIAGTVVHDSSLIYAAADHAVIDGNYFLGGINGNGAVTAIETHGGNQTVTGNVIDGFEVGMNITGVNLDDSEAVTVTGNSMDNIGIGGIGLWSYQYSTHTTGYGLAGVTITGNAIRIKQTAWTSYTGGAYYGIAFNLLSNLPAKTINISSNSIEFDLESSTSGPYNTSAEMGIGYADYTGTNTVDGVKINNNQIKNSPGPGIVWSVSGDNIEINNNQIENPGSAGNTSFLAPYRAGIFINPPSVIPNLTIKGNTITDNNATTRMVYGVTLFNNTLNVPLLGNTINVTGATTTAFLLPYYLYTHTTQYPLIQGAVNVPVGKDLPTQAVTYGSFINSIQAGHWYWANLAGNAWADPGVTFTTGQLGYTSAVTTDGSSGYGPIQNSTLYSQDTTNAAWTKHYATATNNATTNPFGGSDGNLLTETTDNGSHYTAQSMTWAAGANTASAYVQGNGDNLLAQCPSAAFSSFDLTGYTVHSNGLGGTGAIAQVPGTSWYRVSVYCPSESAGTGNIIFYLLNSSFTQSYTGNGTSGVYLWGEQVNQGTLLTYSKTTSAAIASTPYTMSGYNVSATNSLLVGGQAIGSAAFHAATDFANCTAGTGASNCLTLDGSGLVPTANLPTAQKTRTVTITDIGPVTGDDLLIVELDPATAVQLTRFSCGVTGSTSVVTNLVSGGNSLIADMTATTGDINAVVTATWVSGSCSSQTTYCPIAAHTPVTLHIGTISGTPTSLSCALDYTVN